MMSIVIGSLPSPGPSGDADNGKAEKKDVMNQHQVAHRVLLQFDVDSLGVGFSFPNFRGFVLVFLGPTIGLRPDHVDERG